MAAGPTTYLALITPISSQASFPKPQPPGTPGAPGPQPPTGPGGPVDPGYGISIERPSHPIWYPLPPGAPVDPEYGIPEEGLPVIDNTLPGSSGGWAPVYIDNTLPGGSSGIGGGAGETPTHPIVLPEPLPPEGNRPAIEFKAAWTPTTGWIVIGVPTGEHPTPSKKRK